MKMMNDFESEMSSEIGKMPVKKISRAKGESGGMYQRYY